LRELAREHFPDDELAAEIATREAFDTEDIGAYAIDLDMQLEEQGVLETARDHASPGGAPQGAMGVCPWALVATRSTTMTASTSMTMTWTSMTSPNFGR
jgi:hypothetical protein